MTREKWMRQGLGENVRGVLGRGQPFRGKGARLYVIATKMKTNIYVFGVMIV